MHGASKSERSVSAFWSYYYYNYYCGSNNDRYSTNKMSLNEIYTKIRLLLGLKMNQWVVLCMRLNAVFADCTMHIVHVIIVESRIMGKWSDWDRWKKQNQICFYWKLFERERE